ncbi:hypothetical protein G3F08_001168 [Salmonella enterica]|uniref:hypothetical protein n=1 Tax=Salmonella TaxID=590 RepID=UPI000EFF0781|nr:hypothetical protein [Salmonella enterica]EDS0346402.1 hypothetical protein [Salmonella enterica]EDZ1020232.1 hypothetical protein [Salmonella enterica]EEG5828688.1 hypothetical protein [Salmonella enterica]EEG6267580.1 hypothetical protein [Salmonella enterica]EEH5467941.1 hypothetical protein [Salmonella enterica]
MGSNIIELAKLGHERAAELKASCGAVNVRSLAQLISDLATQLEVQLVRGNAQAVQLANAESKCDSLAAENASLKHAMAVTLEHVSVTDTGQAGVAAMIINDSLHHSGTPETDAYLAEVRAQGVEMFMESDECSQEAYGLALRFSDKLRKDANTADLVAAGIITKVGE